MTGRVGRKLSPDSRSRGFFGARSCSEKFGFGRCVVGQAAPTYIDCMKHKPEPCDAQLKVAAPAAVKARLGELAGRGRAAGAQPRAKYDTVQLATLTPG